MDFNLSDEQQMLRDAVSRYVREQYGFEARRKLAAGAGFSAEHWAQYAELGWLALGLPEEVGGLGCSFVETALVAEEFGRGLVLEPYVGCAVLAACILERSREPGFAGQREALLAGIADGRLQVALAHGEAASRYQHEQVDTQAQVQGGAYRLDGVKLLVVGAPSAAHYLVSARLDSGVGLFDVSRATPGLTLKPYALIDGSRAADLLLDSVVVPQAALVAGPGQALELIEEACDRAALAHVAEALGCMEAALELSAEYLKTRQQFGQPIGKFQALQHRMAEMFVEVQETRSILFRGMAHLDDVPAQRRQAVSAAKVMVGSAGRFVGGQCIQLHGGIGVTEEYQVGHYYKRLLVIDKLYGDADWHLGRFVQAQRAA